MSNNFDTSPPPLFVDEPNSLSLSSSTSTSPSSPSSSPLSSSSSGKKVLLRCSDLFAAAEKKQQQSIKPDEAQFLKSFLLGESVEGLQFESSVLTVWRDGIQLQGIPDIVLLHSILLRTNMIRKGIKGLEVANIVRFVLFAIIDSQQEKQPDLDTVSLKHVVDTCVRLLKFSPGTSTVIGNSNNSKTSTTTTLTTTARTRTKPSNENEQEGDEDCSICTIS